MQRKTLLFELFAICAAAIVGCSSPAPSPVSPSAVAAQTSALNPDGSNLKVTAPGNLSPGGGATVDTRRPTLSFNNAVGRFTNIGLAYEIEVLSGSTVVYSSIVGQGASTTSHQLDTDLQYATDYTWHVRGRLGTSDTGPWAPTTSFRTLNAPTAPPPPPPGTGGLPFPVPAECGEGNVANRFPCLLAVASVSAEWRSCAAGVGISCHRFARQVVYALSRTDPNYKMIVAAPGGQACNCNACGPSDGTMFREDTTVYAGASVYVMIGGAGGPSPSLQWSSVGPPRAGDRPDDAPLCVP